MSIELKIKELEAQLATKQAYLSVQFSFPKGSKLSQKIKDQVRKELKKACTQLAEGTSAFIGDAIIAGFSEKELEVLKKIAAVYIDKEKTRPEPPAKGQVTTEEDLQNGVVKSSKLAQQRAILLLLDNIDPTMRNKIESGGIVTVMEQRDGKVFVQDRRTQRFWVPLEDLDFNVE